MSNKVALITGITGQDGAYLTEFLLGKGKAIDNLQPNFFISGLHWKWRMVFWKN